MLDRRFMFSHYIFMVHTWSLFFVLPCFLTSVGLSGCVLKGPAAPVPRGMVPVPAGKFIRGSNRVDEFQQAGELGSKKPWYKDEYPQHEISLPLFYIDRYEVTNAEYKAFIDATGWRPPPYFEDRNIPAGQERFPISQVNWYEAERYCRWKGKRLPSEAEWEKAARGTDGREFPWGNDFEKIKKNADHPHSEEIAPVGSFKEGMSPYGVMDMAGNVWEWTNDWYRSYPNGTFKSALFGEKQKVFRGGGGGRVGHYALPLFYRTAYRSSIAPEQAFADLGFRCAMSP